MCAKQISRRVGRQRGQFRIRRDRVDEGCDVFALESRRRTLLSAFEEELASAAEDAR